MLAEICAEMRRRRAQSLPAEDRHFSRQKVMCLEIFAWLIEHPEGRFIVDTGYLPWWNPFFTTQVSIRVAPHEEIARACAR